MYLEKINKPKDLNKLQMQELKVLSDEIREMLLQKISVYGGHLGSNLGMVELTIALHYVFDSPKDKMVYDVSHQSYVHKILTGRKDAFLYPIKYDTVTGYSNPEESSHDFFTIGHTSTSISLASGLAKARDLKGSHEHIIAIIGDGSLSGGEAYEGLNYIVENGTQMIVIVNDNEMSIAENHGGLYQNLKQLRDTNGKSSLNMFTALGLHYLYVEDGHHIPSLIHALEKAKQYDTPIVLHVHTEKGKGYEPAQTQKEKYHAGGPFDRTTGEYIVSTLEEEDYSELTANYLLKEMEVNKQLVAITAGTPAVMGFHAKQRKQAGNQFVDIGIAEEHAIALASGIAKHHGKPVFAVYSTFLSRAYDQIIQDLCINSNPSVILVFLASIYGMNDVTHLGLFDIAMMSPIPNLIYLAPTTKEEYLAMLSWAINQKQHPVAIRVPANKMITCGVEDKTDYNIKNVYKTVKRGKDIAIIALGSFFALGEEITETLWKKYQVNATLINPKFITGIDNTLLNNLKKEHKIVITLEDGFLEGGFGQKIASFYGDSEIKVKNYGIKNKFIDRYKVQQVMEDNGLQVDSICDEIVQTIKKV